MESLESRGYTIQDQLSKGQYTSVLSAYSTLHQSKVAVKLLPPIDVKCTLVRNAALGGEWMVDLPSEVTTCSQSSSTRVITFILKYSCKARQH